MSSLEHALGAIPIFPLPQVVLFPRAVLPLHVFEPRYRAMLSECLASHGAIAIAQLVAGEDTEGRPRIATVCGGGVVVEHHPLEGGRSNIKVLGVARLRLDELGPDESSDRSYRIARATILGDLPVSVPENARVALASAATMFTATVKKHDAQFSFSLPREASAGELADICAYHLVIDAGARQAALEELDPRVRVDLVLNQLALQGAVMRSADVDGVTN